MNSWYGAGWFTLAQHAHYPAHHMTLTAGTGPHYANPPFEGCTDNGYGNPGWNPTTSEIAMIKTQLRNAAKIFFGMTEGSQYIAQVNFYNNNNCVTGCNGGICSVCFTNCPNGTGGIVHIPGGGIVINRDYNGNAYGLAHEMGHHYFNGGDEYLINTSLAQCGHSMMANNSENFQHNVCNNFNHGFDPSPNAGAPPVDSRWQAAYSQAKTPYWLFGTPDNYDYVGFDFDGLVGYVP